MSFTNFREIAPGISIWNHSRTRFLVRVPYRPEFAGRAMAMEGRYKRKTVAWSFYKERKAAVVRAINEVFGTDIDIGVQL